MTNPVLTGIDLEADELDGTGNALFDVIWIVQECKTYNRRLTGFIKDAQKADDADLIAFFEKAKEANEASLAEAMAKVKIRLQAQAG